MPHDLIFLTTGGVQFQFQREEQYFTFLGTYDRCYNPIIFGLTSLEMSQKYTARTYLPLKKVEWVINSRLLLNFEISISQKTFRNERILSVDFSTYFIVI